MANPSVKKRLLKIILLVIFLLVALPSVTITAYGGLNYYQANNLKTEADSLLKAERFDQAIEKYALAEAKWSPKSLKDEISISLEEAQKLKKEKEDFERGIGYFDEEKWEGAKEFFEKITDISKYFDDAQEKLRIIEEKIKAEEEAEEKVQGVKATSTPTSTTTQVPQPTATPQPASSQNKDTLIVVPVVPNTANGNTDYEVPKDSKGIPCYSNASHCKYECNDSDDMIDAWLKNLRFYETGLVANPSYQQKIDETKAKIIQSCGRIP